VSKEGVRMSKRRKFTPEFKAQIVLEVLSGPKVRPRPVASTASGTCCFISGARSSWGEPPGCLKKTPFGRL